MVSGKESIKNGTVNEHIERKHNCRIITVN